METHRQLAAARKEGENGQCHDEDEEDPHQEGVHVGVADMQKVEDSCATRATSKGHQSTNEERKMTGKNTRTS